MKTKKGEITTQQIVLLIVLLVSFIVLLFLLFRLDFGRQSNSEICHNSVVARGSSVIPTDAVPLKCSRTYVCITNDGSCESLTKPEIKKVATKDEVYSALAEEMANCWWEFGEGKVNYVSSTMTKDNYCSICSQIAFDDSVEKIDGIGLAINEDDFYNYLSLTPAPGKDMNYAQYFFRTNNISTLKEGLSNQAGKEVSFGNIYTQKQYFVVMGITSEVNTIGWVVRGAALGGLAVVGVAVAGVGTAGLIAVAVGEIAAGGAGAGVAKISDLISPKIGAITIEGEGVENKFMVPTIQEANSDEFKLLNCQEVVTSA
jgi:hypothetical protein